MVKGTILDGFHNIYISGSAQRVFVIDMTHTIKEIEVGSTGMKENSNDKNKAALGQRFADWLRGEKDTIKRAARNFGEGVGGGALSLLAIAHFVKYTTSVTLYTNPYVGPFNVKPGQTFNLDGSEFLVAWETSKSIAMNQVLPKGALSNPFTVSGNPYNSTGSYTVLTMHNNVITSVQSLPYTDIGHVFNSATGTNSIVYLWGSSNPNGTFALYAQEAQYHLSMIPNWAAQVLSPEHAITILFAAGFVGAGVGIAVRLLRKGDAKD